MKLNELESEIAAKEGKKSQTSIGNIREMIKILRKLLKGPRGPEVMRTLLK